MRPTLLKNVIKLTIFLATIFSLTNSVMSGPVNYDICTGQCNISAVDCFAAENLMFSPVAVAGCTVSLSLCMFNCEPNRFNAFTP